MCGYFGRLGSWKNTSSLPKYLFLSLSVSFSTLYFLLSLHSTFLCVLKEMNSTAYIPKMMACLTTSQDKEKKRKTMSSPKITNP